MAARLRIPQRYSITLLTGRRLDQPAALLALLITLLFLGEGWAILTINEGHFIYTLDDPYIHLQLAQNILHGHYGIDPTQVSAPSSSILWPLLLVPFSGLSAAQFIPLGLNLALTIASVMLAFRAIRASVEDKPLAFLLGLIFPLATNLVGLALTGMEHSLQVLLSLGLLAGIIREQRTGVCPRWIWPVILLGPLVRYENLVLVLPALAYLVWRGAVRPAAITAGLLVGLLGGFSAFLYSLGLGLLPSSVLAKSAVISASPGAFNPLANFADNLKYAGIPAFILASLLLLWKLFRPRDAGERQLALLLLASETGYLLLGRFGWFSRYEVFLLAVLLLALVYLYASPVPSPSRPSGRKHALIQRAGAAVSLPMVLLAIFPQYLAPLVYSPQAANNVYEQQYQMRRFAQEYYRAPVAVNDLGLVSYQNPYPVLDLWGLGSAEALASRTERADPDWMDRLAGEQGVGLAMIYTEWFPDLPERWTRIAGLTMSRPPVATGGSTVSFYVTSEGDCPAVRAALIAFRTTLPAGVRLEIANCPG